MPQDGKLAPAFSFVFLWGCGRGGLIIWGVLIIEFQGRQKGTPSRDNFTFTSGIDERPKATFGPVFPQVGCPHCLLPAPYGFLMADHILAPWPAKIFCKIKSKCQRDPCKYGLAMGNTRTLPVRSPWWGKWARKKTKTAIAEYCRIFLVVHFFFSMTKSSIII